MSMQESLITRQLPVDVWGKKRKKKLLPKKQKVMPTTYTTTLHTSLRTHKSIPCFWKLDVSACLPQHQALNPFLKYILINLCAGLFFFVYISPKFRSVIEAFKGSLCIHKLNL